MKKDRFLWTIVGVIVGLIAVALVLFFSRQRSLEYTADRSPKGVVRNYVVALLKKDYVKAYSYLKEGSLKPSLEDFTEAFETRQLDPGSVSLEIGEARIETKKATVDILILHTSTDPFSSGYNENAVATLERDQQGDWKLASMPYPYWGWDWYNPPVEPLPAPGSD